MGFLCRNKCVSTPTSLICFFILGSFPSVCLALCWCGSFYVILIRYIFYYYSLEACLLSYERMKVWWIWVWGEVKRGRENHSQDIIWGGNIFSTKENIKKKNDNSYCVLLLLTFTFSVILNNQSLHIYLCKIMHWPLCALVYHHGSNALVKWSNNSNNPMKVYAW